MDSLYLDRSLFVHSLVQCTIHFEEDKKQFLAQTTACLHSPEYYRQVYETAFSIAQNVPFNV